MQEEKLEQLRKIFKKTVEGIIGDIKGYSLFDTSSATVDGYSESIANKLVYEVKIRINNKGGEKCQNIYR